ncbi:MAG TPA: ATP-binding protein, partial [Gammaproteobacteria bacterium]|nr:ATP-binding protein [Gammaproteobacteria bacterium]
SGTGLGLTIAQELVAHHRGLIDVESEPGATRFTIRLPCDLGSEGREEIQS